MAATLVAEEKILRKKKFFRQQATIKQDCILKVWRARELRMVSQEKGF